MAKWRVTGLDVAETVEADDWDTDERWVSFTDSEGVKLVLRIEDVARIERIDES